MDINWDQFGRLFDGVSVRFRKDVLLPEGVVVILHNSNPFEKRLKRLEKILELENEIRSKRGKE